MTCSVGGCDRRVSTRGWCAMHYQRWYRHGDPLTVLDMVAAECGTETGYKNGCRCDACRAAATEARRRRRARMSPVEREQVRLRDRERKRARRLVLSATGGAES